MARPSTKGTSGGELAKLALRDQFAMAAINGLLTNQHSQDPDWLAENGAKQAYDIADAMLAQRDERPTTPTKGEKDE